MPKQCNTLKLLVIYSNKLNPSQSPHFKNSLQEFYNSALVISSSFSKLVVSVVDGILSSMSTSDLVFRFDFWPFSMNMTPELIKKF